MPNQTRRRLYVSSRAGVTWTSGDFASTTFIKCVLIISIKRILACIAKELSVCRDMGVTNSALAAGAEGAASEVDEDEVFGGGSIASSIIFSNLVDMSLLLLSAWKEEEEPVKEREGEGEGGGGGGGGGGGESTDKY